MNSVTGTERTATLTERARTTFLLLAVIALSVFATDHATPASARSMDTASAPIMRDVTPADIVTTIQAPQKPATPTVLTRIKSGLASWYGDMWQGKQTASGRIFNMYEMTAAHKTLPFGSKVKVTDLRNRRSVVVTITDRGDLPGRVIDLSLAAARELRMIGTGVDPVRLELVSYRN